jgi:hypothetical protein
MKKLLFFLGFMFASANAMTVYWNGETGKIIETEIYNPKRIDWDKVGYLTHMDMLTNVGATGIKVIQQPCRWNDGIGQLEIWW